MMDASKVSVIDAAVAIGLTQHDKRWGPCPACGANRESKRRRGPLRVTHDGWWCNADAGCEPDKGRDAVDLVSWFLLGRPPEKGDPELRRVFEYLGISRAPASLDREAVKTKGMERIAELRRLRDITEPERPAYPDRNELIDAFQKAFVPACEDAEVSAYLRSRGYDPALVHAGAILPGFEASWWFGTWSSVWRLVVPAYDGHGVLRTMQARAIRSPLPETWPKTRAPVGCQFKGVLFANPQGRAFLHGEGSARRILIVEGLTDFVRATMARPEWAVLGYTSGSRPALEQARERIMAQGVEVHISTDSDRSGEAYAAQVADVLFPYPCQRVSYNSPRAVVTVSG